MSAGLPPPFLIGESYIDRDGIYTVVDVQGSRVLVERPSGERVLADATVKARIHRNMRDQYTGLPLHLTAPRVLGGGRPRLVVGTDLQRDLVMVRSLTS